MAFYRCGQSGGSAGAEYKHATQSEWLTTGLTFDFTPSVVFAYIDYYISGSQSYEIGSAVYDPSKPYGGVNLLMTITTAGIQYFSPAITLTGDTVKGTTSDPYRSYIQNVYVCAVE